MDISGYRRALLAGLLAFWVGIRPEPAAAADSIRLEAVELVDSNGHAVHQLTTQGPAPAMPIQRPSEKGSDPLPFNREQTTYGQDRRGLAPFRIASPRPSPRSAYADRFTAHGHAANPTSGEMVRSREAEWDVRVPRDRSLQSLPYLPCRSDIPLSEDCWVPCERFIPHMLGDFIGEFFYQPGPAPNTQPRAAARTFTRYKVADNNSPLPRSRALYSYNFFNEAFDTEGNVHRHFFGGEWAFRSPRASIEVKSSVNYLADFASAPDTHELGDLRATVKALLRRTDVYALAAGLAIGYPTGDAPGGLDQDAWYVAPYLAWLHADPERDWFVQLFEQLDIPSERQDQTVLHSDVGVGYYLFEGGNGYLTVVPTAELHLYTPVGTAGGFYRQLNYDDVLNLTLGSTFYFDRAMTLALGVGIPLSEHDDYELEFQAHLNYHFGGTP